MSLNILENAWINYFDYAGFSICLSILDTWQGFEYALVYARVLNMLHYSYNNIIIIVTNVITLEFLST